MKKAPGTLRRVLRLLRPYRAYVAGSILLAAVFVAASLYVPVLVGNAIDCIVAPGQVDFAAVAACGATIAVVAAAAAVCQWAMQALNNRVCFGVTRDVREQAFAHVQQLPLAYLDQHPSGELVSRMIADVDQFADGLLMGFTQLFTGVLSIFGTLGFMLWLDWKIALVVVVLTPVSLFAAKFIAGRTYSMFRLQSQTRGEQTAFLGEMVAGQKVVRVFSREQETLREFDGINDRLERASLRATFFSSLVNPTTRFLTSVVYACVGLTGALAAVQGAISVGALSCFLSYANQYAKPFNEISGVVTELQNALACAGRVFELIDAPVQTPDAPGVLQEPSGEVALQNVSFRYTPDRPLIEDLNLSVRPGQRIAIVGPTGCGKTTLINLLMRFYDVDGGSISVSGMDVRDVTRASLRRSYGMVLQDTWLKTGTVRENICMGKPGATDGEMIAAAKASHAHSFIAKLPQGYDTVISADGSLSQGQRQLLCITRVMLCLPPMLILDEATSSIDTRTELRIQQAFDRMMQGRTSFIVAHRLSTIREADVILVMRDGHIVEQGTHDALLQKNGFYAKLYNSQFAH
ncbi:MAG: ABC transporter ATP-binding protein/permease [Clostridiales bacterium]|nr:ABC transporter ATP-binding protein/permease [Clostridiales bacterium]